MESFTSKPVYQLWPLRKRYIFIFHPSDICQFIFNHPINRRTEIEKLRKRTKRLKKNSNNFDETLIINNLRIYKKIFVIYITYIFRKSISAFLNYIYKSENVAGLRKITNVIASI